MTRLHARQLELLVIDTKYDERWSGRPMYYLGSPKPGLFKPLVQATTWCRPGTLIGTLEVLGAVHELVVPHGATGSSANSVDDRGGSLEARAVGYGDLLVMLDTRETPMGVGGAVEAATGAIAAAGLVFRAPTSGRFYGRPTADKPSFVSVGDQLVQGTTICLLEVMKTFNRVTYGGAGMPERAKVREILVADGSDVTAGDALLALE